MWKTIVITIACTLLHAQSSKENFADYWYTGLAELNHYQLEQARYGEIHRGDAMLIFVTEDFLTDPQVKHEYGPKDQSVSVLKLNFTRSYLTGIYPYTLMSSIFTPIDNLTQPLKISTSVQEWCGQTYLQMNRRNSAWQIVSHSYFQAEGDQQATIKAKYTEDGLWNVIRLDPQQLPVGEFTIFPGTQFIRLRHQSFKVVKATGKLSQEGSLFLYTLDYPDLMRKLSFHFDQAFPHIVREWSAEGPSGFGANPQILKTRAVLTHTKRLAYWNLNGVDDAYHRNDLGIKDP